MDHTGPTNRSNHPKQERPRGGPFSTTFRPVTFTLDNNKIHSMPSILPELELGILDYSTSKVVKMKVDSKKINRTTS